MLCTLAKVHYKTKRTKLAHHIHDYIDFSSTALSLIHGKRIGRWVGAQGDALNFLAEWAVERPIRLLAFDVAVSRYKATSTLAITFTIHSLDDAAGGAVSLYCLGDVLQPVVCLGCGNDHQ